MNDLMSVAELSISRGAVGLTEDLAEVIGQVGYYDQAHMTRALRRFVGQTPGQLSRESRAA